MFRFTQPLASVLSALLTAQTLAQAPAIKEVRLSRASVALDQDFTRISGAYELPDGRLLVSDRGEEKLVVADLSRGTVTPIGRSGSGPAEYRFPDRLIRWAGDSILLVDEGNGRLLVVAPDLRIVRSFVLNVPGVPTSLVPRGVDPQGRMFAQVPRWAAGGFGRRGDSVPIVRVAAPGAQPEVVTWVVVLAEPRDGIKRGLPYIPFSPQDTWTATPGGELVIARAGDYHIEWLAGNGVRRGARIEYQPVRVTEKDKLVYTRSFLEHSSIGGRGGANATPTGLSALPAEMLTPEAVKQLAEVNPFAEVKAPFTDNLPLLRDDRLWIQRSTPVDALPTWDVFDRQGNPVLRVVLPAGRRAIALGRGAVYALVENEEGFERVERFEVGL